MTRLSASVLGFLLVPLSAFVYFLVPELVLIVAAGDAIPHGQVSRSLVAALFQSGFSSPVTAPVGAILGLVLFQLAARGPRGARLLAFPLGFAAGIICTYGTEAVLLREIAAYRSGNLEWPLWLYGALVSYGLSILLTAINPAHRIHTRALQQGH